MLITKQVPRWPSIWDSRLWVAERARGIGGATWSVHALEGAETSFPRSGQAIWVVISALCFNPKLESIISGRRHALLAAAMRQGTPVRSLLWIVLEAIVTQQPWQMERGSNMRTDRRPSFRLKIADRR